MKKTIFLMALLPFFTAGCVSIWNNDVNELKGQVEQLKKDVAELQRTCGIVPSLQPDEESDKKSEKTVEKDTSNTLKTDKQQAIEAIRYCLRMYTPSLKYTAIRGMEKPDGTADVIIDYDKYGSPYHTYYNVSTYEDGQFQVNEIDGLEGQFPHGERFLIEQ